MISALGQVDDVGRCVTMDLKEPGNCLYQVGLTRDELGGSHFALVKALAGGQVPHGRSRSRPGRRFAAVHRAIDAGLVRACHDLSEGGLAVAAAEMAFAGGLGATARRWTPCRATASLRRRPCCCSANRTRGSSAKSGPSSAAAFEAALAGVPHARIGEVIGRGELEIVGATAAIAAELAALKEAWQKPLRW